MTSRRVLVTGGAGFLGTYLAHRFREAGLPVRLFDLAEGPGIPHEPGLEYVRGDVRDSAAVAAALERVDTVVHAAFASPQQPREVVWSVNVEGTRNLCERALARGVRRLILISSTIVLKPPKAHPLFKNSPLTRLDRYRVSRLEAEEIVAESGSQGLSAAIVRPKTFMGPGRVSAFAIILEWIRRGRTVLVLGTGTNRYQLLDIRDMTEGIRLLEATDAQGIFFFGARDVNTVVEDLQALLDHARTGARLRFVPGRVARAALRGLELANVMPLSEWHYMSAYGEDSVVDISRAERDLGWQPQRSNARMLMETYDWYVASVMTTGRTTRTHRVPLAHRVLKGLSWMLPR